MVIKTETCAFSGLKIFPGRGKRFVRQDARAYLFIHRKQSVYYLMKRNPRKLPWTQFYRRFHKKGTAAEEVHKRKNRGARSTALSRGIVGASIDEIKAKRTENPQRRLAAREALVRDIKTRKKADAAKKKAERPKTAAPSTKAQVPKTTKAPSKPNKTGGGKR